MKHINNFILESIKTERLGFVFDNQTYKYEYLVYDMKTSWVFGFGTDDNSPDAIEEYLNTLKNSNNEIQGGSKTANAINSLHVGEQYSIKNKLIICVKEKNKTKIK